MFSSRFRLGQLLIVALVSTSFLGYLSSRSAGGSPPENGNSLDAQLASVLKDAGFTGSIEATLEARLGRKVDVQLADLGRNLIFDTSAGLNNGNTCAGCHSPTAGGG